MAKQDMAYRNAWKSPFRGLGLVVLILTTIFIWLLERPWGALPALGRLIDPVNGCWANAEPVNKNFSAELNLPVTNTAAVWFDGRMVPHIHAGKDHDL